ncbi:response regulator, partial [Singulisphaera rosea]
RPARRCSEDVPPTNVGRPARMARGSRIGGTILIDSGEGEGTLIRARIPINRSSEGGAEPESQSTDQPKEEPKVVKLRIVLADDHNVIREGLRALIDSQPDMEVVGEAPEGETACRRSAELVPDVVVMDISMPLLGGAQATERIRRESPGVKVLALTVHEDRGYLQQMIQAGASGYLLKRAAADDLIQAIRTVARGGTYLDPNLTGELLGDLVQRSPRPNSPTQALSDREEEVLRLIARGFTNREVASQLEVSSKTIETHKARAMEKLDLESRAAIVAYAIRAGWLSGH